MIKEDLVAERIAIDSYREMIAYLGNDDPTTRRMMEGILAMEEEHADDLVSLLEELAPSKLISPNKPTLTLFITARTLISLMSSKAEQRVKESQ